MLISELIKVIILYLKKKTNMMYQGMDVLIGALLINGCDGKLYIISFSKRGNRFGLGLRSVYGLRAHSRSSVTHPIHCII